MKARERLKEIEAALEKRANQGKTNFNPSMCVQIMNNYEGTFQFYESALVYKEEDYWYIIPEHHPSVFYYDDEVDVRLYQRVWKEDLSFSLTET